MITQWVVLPTVGAFIGYVTNVVAIRMLFRPRTPYRIPGTPWVVQGVIPMRRSELAQAVGTAVQDELLPVDYIMDKLDITGYKADVINTVAAHVDKRVRSYLPKFLPLHLQDTITALVRDLVERETGDVLESVTETVRNRVRSELNVSELVREKVEELDLEALEQLVLRVARRELRHIEVLGAVLGFIIGLGQAGLLAILP